MSDDALEMEAFRISGVDVESAFRSAASDSVVVRPDSKQLPGKHKQAFVRACPVAWLRPAVGLPGKALASALVCWYVAGRAKDRTINVYPRALREFGVQRKAFLFGLQAIEKAGLVSVDRRRGRSPIVTILLPEESHG